MQGKSIIYQKSSGNPYLQILRILISPQILLSPSLLKKFELIFFQDLIHKSNFDTDYKRAVFSLPERPVRDKYSEVFIILLLPQILIPTIKKHWEISRLQLITFHYLIHQNNLQTSYEDTTFNLPKKILVADQYLMFLRTLVSP